MPRSPRESPPPARVSGSVHIDLTVGDRSELRSRVCALERVWPGTVVRIHVATTEPHDQRGYDVLHFLAHVVAARGLQVDICGEPEAVALWVETLRRFIGEARESERASGGDAS